MMSFQFKKYYRSTLRLDLEARFEFFRDWEKKWKNKIAVSDNNLKGFKATIWLDIISK